MSGKRVYRSPLRAEAAERTHEEILREATRLFATRGYARVTVADIAEAAGVSSKTVFASVGSKRTVMDEIVDRAVAVSGYQETVEHILTLTTPGDVLRALAAGTRHGNEHQFAVLEAIRKALPTHEDGEALWARATKDYRQALAEIAGHLEDVGPRQQRPAGELADLLWWWFGPDAWRTLVVDSQWSWDRTQDILGTMATQALQQSPA